MVPKMFGPYFTYFQQAVRKAYESVLVVSPRRPTTNEFLEFEKEVIRRALSVYNYTWSEKEEVSALPW